MFLPTDRRDRWVFSMTWDPTRETRADYPPERLVELIRAGAGAPDLDPEIVWTGDFTFTAQIADRYREGRAFLVGDAAHRMTPRGAAGMNTAIHDGYDLGWKLGWVLRGWADESLLDTYEAERRPVGLRNMQRSAVAVGAARRLPGLPRRHRRPDPARVAARRPHSTLDLLGDGLTVLAGPDARSGRGPTAAASRSRRTASTRRPRGAAASGTAARSSSGPTAARGAVACGGECVVGAGGRGAAGGPRGAYGSIVEPGQPLGCLVGDVDAGHLGAAGAGAAPRDEGRRRPRRRPRARLPRSAPERLRTQPDTPSRCASCESDQRKPTPCTNPWTTRWWRIIASSVPVNPRLTTLDRQPRVDA